MKKIIGILIIMVVFCLGLGAGHYFHDSNLEIPGLAMAASPTAKPTIRMRIVNFSARTDGRYNWGVFITTDRPLVGVEQKNSTKVAIYTK